MNIENLKYPIGKFQPLETYTFDDIQPAIQDIEYFPSALRAIVADIPEESLEWRYRPEGWTIRQVIHHCADSHLNAFCRYKLALTEDKPQIKPYLEAKWAELADHQAPISFSVDLLENLHVKWTYLLRSMSEEDFGREYFHPEAGQYFSLYHVTMMYAWHGNHHLAHIKQGLASSGEYV